jgi:uncharacterized protein (DUF58 family)
MKRTAAPKLGAYAGLTAFGLLAALVLGQPLVVALAAPFAVVLVGGLLFSDDPRLEAVVRLNRERVLEGDEIALELELWAAHEVPRLDLLVRIPDGLEIEDGRNPMSIRLDPNETRKVTLKLRATRWGGYLLGGVVLRAQDHAGLFRYDLTLPRDLKLRVFPREEQLRSLLRPRETQPYVGDEVSRRRGDGIEFADMRPFAFGDTVSRINWRATARRGELWVNDRHPERNTDIVLFLDAFTEARRSEGGTLDYAVRAAASLAREYIAKRDRVGLIGFGGSLRWLLPGMGQIQLYRICEALIDTQILLTYAWRDIIAVPARVLPPHAIVVALTPLIDERSINALLDLRARGYDLAVIETSPVPYVEPGTTPVEALAFRLWELRRESLRQRLRQSGVAVTEWRKGTPLAVGVEEVGAFRRYAYAGRG